MLFHLHLLFANEGSILKKLILTFLLLLISCHKAPSDINGILISYFAGREEKQLSYLIESEQVNILVKEEKWNSITYVIKLEERANKRKYGHYFPITIDYDKAKKEIIGRMDQWED